MIRRNHIESVSKIQRQSLRNKERTPHIPQRQARYAAAKRTPEVVVVDENYRATSSNKKYHQYKDWKEHHRNQQVNQQINSSNRKSKGLLATRPFDENVMADQQQIRKDYDQELQTLMRKQYTSKIEQQAPKRRTSASGQNLTYNYFETHQQQKQHEEEYNKPQEPRNYSQRKNIQYEYPVLQSPPKKNYNYQSNRKRDVFAQNDHLHSKYKERSGSNMKPSMPLFNEVELFRPKNNYTTSSSYKSNPKPLSTKLYDYPSLPLSPKKDQQPRRPYIDHPSYFPKDQTPRNKPTQLQFRPVSVRPDQEKDQKVTSKLKMISSFNDQINERIKSIIVSFEELRNKL